GAQGERRRRYVAQRLRLSALSRRAHVLGRSDWGPRGLQPDRDLAPALRRALEALEAPAGGGGERRLAARGQGQVGGVGAGGMNFDFSDEFAAARARRAAMKPRRREA